MDVDWFGLANAALYHEANPCAKCGQLGAGSLFQGGRYMPLAAMYMPEHIRRTCTRCGYSWNELPLDTKGEGNGTGLS